MTRDNATTKTATTSIFGLSAQRVRGFVAIILLLTLIYFTLFESEPPPVFTEVEITIPPRPVAKFDEKTIILPDFKDSPVTEEEPGTNVEISKVAVQNKPTLQKQEEVVNEVQAKPAEPKITALTQEKVKENVATAINQNQKVPTEENIVAKQGFFVQVSALKNKQIANEQAKFLRELLNVATYVQPVLLNDSQLYRVRLGPFGDDQGKAREVLARLLLTDAKIGEHAFVDEN